MSKDGTCGRRSLPFSEFSTMVSLARSTSALVFSFCHSTRALLAGSSRSSIACRRSFLTTTAGLVAVACFPHPKIAAAQGHCNNPSFSSTSRSMSTGYLNAADAAALDAELMSTPGFSLEQLMELAGLSVAEAVYQVIPPTTEKKPSILLICGPGNNGGDGLVAARHLVFFGFECVVVYPKKSSQQHFINLVQQCKDVDVTILDEMPADLTSFDAIVDSIFGFSFKGAPREPFATILNQMMDAQQKGGVPVISVDVPSGWNVDEGDVAGTGFVPNVLVSLTTPKESARGFKGRHFIGGRFLPPKLAQKYKVQMPPYPGVSQVMEVTNISGESSSSSSIEHIAGDGTGWEAEYAAYLAEKESHHLREADPVSTNAVQNEDSWERQYAEYCAEKETRLAAEDAKRIQDMKEQRA